VTILVCGEALYDVFVGEPGPEGFALDARMGGSAFNLARGLARLGQPAGLLTGIGTDPMGERLAATLAAEGVATAWLARSDLRTTLALVAVGPDGGARYAFYGEGAADRAVSEADLPALDGVSTLVFGCLSLVTEPTGASFLTLARRAAVAPDRPAIVLDPNIRPSVEPDMARWRDRVDAFAACADMVKVSAEDLAALHPDLTPAQAAARWQALGAGPVVVTDGGEGATAHADGGALHVPAPAVTVIDTVGAGDSFLAGFLAAAAEAGALSPAGLRGLSGAALAGALGFAARAAALTCGRRGADLPRRAELDPATAMAVRG
jgi:fructokinase